MTDKMNVTDRRQYTTPVVLAAIGNEYFYFIFF